MRVRIEEIDQDFWKKVGKRIAETREGLKISQEKLAESVSTGTKNIGQIERGEHGSSVPLLLLISQTLNVSLDYLLMGAASQREHITHHDRQELEKIIKYLAPCSDRELNTIYSFLVSILSYIRSSDIRREGGEGL